MSERDAAGRLMRIPGIVDADATIPNRSDGVPRVVANGLRTGLLDIVELKMAKAPTMQKTTKK